MTKPKDRGAGGSADIEDLARRFHDLWRDQLAAMAADPEFTEMTRRWFDGVPGGGHAIAGSVPKTGSGSGADASEAFDPFNPMAWLAAFGAVSPGAGQEGKKQPDDSTAARGTAPSTTGTETTAASSRARDVAGDELERRLANLEQRLERLEAAIGGQGRGAAPRPRKSRP